MPTEELVKILSDGCIHSGEALGASLGVSRVAVWKRLKKLDDIGIEVETIKGKGYRLGSPLDLLDGPTIRSHFDVRCDHCISAIEIFFQIESTNTWLLERSRDSGINGVVCLAEQQVAGRGRRGREWVSPFGRNIYMSIGWEFAQGAAVLEGLSLAVGVAMVRALSSVGVQQLALKWPNDLISSGKKLAGILLEMSGDASGSCSVVIGIGLNVDMQPADANKIDQPWTDVASVLGSTVSRNLLIGRILKELIPILGGYQEVGFSHYQAEWNQCDYLLGQPVELNGMREAISGVARGVDASGALIVDTESGAKYIKGGEVSVRKVST